MPAMDGFETAEVIRRRKRCQNTPIIFLTAMRRAEHQMFQGLCSRGRRLPGQAARAGGAAVEGGGLRRDLPQDGADQAAGRAAASSWNSGNHERQLADAKERWEAERLQEELRIARQIQQKLFPVAPLPLPGLDIAGASFPAEATGGDYFDYIPMRDGSLAVVIGDVCGHGFGPALVMAELRAYLRAFLLTRTDVGEIVGLLNHALADDTDRFVTLLIAKLDPAASFAGVRRRRPLARIHPGCQWRGEGAAGEHWHAIGGLARQRLPDGVRAAPAARRDGLLLTDGIIEAHGPDGEAVRNRSRLATRGGQPRPARARES